MAKHPFTSLGSKIVAAMIGASVIGSGAALYSNLQLGKMDAAFQHVMATEVPGALKASELMTQSQRLGGLSYRLVTEFKATDIEISRKDIEKAQADIKSQIETLKVIWPGKAGEISAMTADFNMLTAGMAKALEAAFGGDPDKTASVTQELVTPSIKAFNAKVKSFAEAAELALAERRRAVAVEVTQASQLGFVITGLGGLLTLFGGLFFARRVIARPVIHLTQAMQAIAGGQTGVTIPGIVRQDELGMMAQTVAVFRDNVEQVQRQEAEKITLAGQEKANRQMILDQLAATFETSVGAVIAQLDTSAQAIEHNAGELAGIASDSSQRTGSVARASLAMADNIRSAAAATDEIVKTINDISISIDRSQTVANDAANQTEMTVGIVQQLAEATQKIGSVAHLISSIASQTNLLALNATIEAARAGEAGRGFAVVASEVKALANQTSQATDEISVQIEAVQRATKDAVAAIATIDTTITQVKDITAEIAEAVQIQNASMHRISGNVAHAVEGSDAVSQSMVEVSQAAERTGVAAVTMKSSSSVLTASAADLNREVEQFLRSVRAS